jgi:GAF domain-containing protein
VEGDDTLLLMFCEIGRGLEAAASPEQIGATLWSNLRRHVPASAFVLFAYDAGSDALVVLHEAGDTSTGLAGARIQLGERLSGWVAATGQSILNSDARLDLNEDTRDGTPLRSALAVPIFSGDRVAGVLSFYAREENAFDDTHRRLVHTAAHAVAGTVARVAPATVTAAHPQRVLQRHTRT